MRVLFRSPGDPAHGSGGRIARRAPGSGHRRARRGARSAAGILERTREESMIALVQLAAASLIALVALAPAAFAAGDEYDLVLRNARIVDGTGAPWYRGDIGVRGD